MNYKGKELKEADGKDYPLSNTPKKSAGVKNWLHAAEIPTPTVRPFKSAEELDKAVTVHGPFVLGVTSGIRYLITSYGSNALSLDGDGYTMATVMREFTFLDGAPFGVVEA